MEGSIELRQHLYIIRKWLWLIILATLSAAGVTHAVSINTPSIYRASATLLINEADSPTSATYQDILSSERVARTYAELPRKRPILEGTAARLGLRDVDVRELPFSVDVKPIRDTQLIELGVESTHPGLAAQGTVGHSRSPFSEAYPTLRTNIQFSSPDRPLRTLPITSASPGEGKSPTAANLGVVIAQAGQRVILLDSNLRRPTLHRRFGLSNESGLTNALFHEGHDVGRYLQEAAVVENLRILTSGPLPANPSGLLGSQRMKSLMEKLKAHGEGTVFDSPPSLPVTDAAVLTNLADGTIPVTDAGTTRRGLAERAKHALDQVGANILGASLNRVSLNGSGRPYHYHYHYADGDKHRRRKKRGLGREPLRRIPLSWSKSAAN